jgi:hypothetical protein
MEPGTKIARPHCYGATTVVGYQAHTCRCYLYAVDNGKIEQWEKNRSNKSAYQAGYNKILVVMEKAKVHYS